MWLLLYFHFLYLDIVFDYLISYGFDHNWNSRRTEMLIWCTRYSIVLCIATPYLKLLNSSISHNNIINAPSSTEIWITRNDKQWTKILVELTFTVMSKMVNENRCALFQWSLDAVHICDVIKVIILASFFLFLNC